MNPKYLVVISMPSQRLVKSAYKLLYTILRSSLVHSVVNECFKIIDGVITIIH